MLKKITLAFLSLMLFSPVLVFAQNEAGIQPTIDRVFKAKVIKIIEEKTIERQDGSKSLQQNLLLRGLEKEWKNKEFEHRGVSDLDVASANMYKVGDKVMVSEVKNLDGNTDYYITDLVRSGYLFWLAFLFSVIIIIIGKKKGVKSLISLIVSFFIIIKFIIPKIMSGSSPLLVGIFGALIILAIIIYLTEGWSKKSHIAVVSVLFSLVATFILSWIFTNLTRLTGLAQEEATFLLGANNGSMDFRGLLLTGILIGAVGVLDDVIVGQVESVKQLRQANPNLTNGQIFKLAYEVGNTHLGAIVNTLFLTYAGASLPLLLLFYMNSTGTISFTQVINNEMIATEIVRTLVGSIGVALSMPISTFLATIWMKIK
ncbi:MAG: YibE/F family protein [Candidatus Magasanikbacteria bacterium]